MRNLLLAVCPALIFTLTAAADAQPTRENLTYKKSRATKELEARQVSKETRIPVFEFKENYYNRSNRRPDIFQAIATILTKDVRLFKDWLITDVIWEYDTGNMLCMQAEPPSTKGMNEKFYASEIRSITIRMKNGHLRYYVFDDKKQALRPAMRGIHINQKLIDRYASDRKRRAANYGPGSVERIQPTKEEVTNCGLERPEVRFAK